MPNIWHFRFQHYWYWTGNALYVLTHDIHVHVWAVILAHKLLRLFWSQEMLILRVIHIPIPMPSIYLFQYHMGGNNTKTYWIFGNVLRLYHVSRYSSHTWTFNYLGSDIYFKEIALSSFHAFIGYLIKVSNYCVSSVVTYIYQNKQWLCIHVLYTTDILFTT